MTLRKYRLRYNNVKSDELCAFVKSRTGVAPEPKKHRSVYIKQLHELDDEATFRFMDLPPEMRNLVYEYLLTHNKKLGLSADPQVLRISKQIHKEATGILSAESSLQIDATMVRADDDFSYDDSDFGEFTIAEGQIYGRISFSRLSWYPANEAGKLEAIYSARNVNIDMRIWGDESVDRSARWTSLESFCEELAKNCQDMLSVKISFALDQEHWGVESRIASARALSSLRNLPSGCVLDLQGLDDDTYQLYWKGIAEE